jgi:hypothetical protein
MPCATASIKNPFTMSKSGQTPQTPALRPDLVSSSLEFGVKMIETGGAYRDRTDDPLLAKQVLSQLS